MARYPNAIWRESPKHGYPSTDMHANEGVVIHSAEGSLAAALGVIDGPREASWHFFVCKDGKVYQHIDTSQIAWTNGSFESNRRFWGIENEGVKGEALTEPQFAALRDLVRWLFPGPYIRGKTMWEHREMTAYGSTPTACPSGRIPWVALIAAMEEDMPTQAEFDALKDRVDAIVNSGGALTLQQIQDNIVLNPEGHITVTPWLINEIAKRLPAGGYTDAQAVKAVKDKLG